MRCVKVKNLSPHQHGLLQKPYQTLWTLAKQWTLSKVYGLCQSPLDLPDFAKVHWICQSEKSWPHFRRHGAKSLHRQAKLHRVSDWHAPALAEVVPEILTPFQMK